MFLLCRASVMRGAPSFVAHLICGTSDRAFSIFRKKRLASNVITVRPLIVRHYVRYVLVLVRMIEPSFSLHGKSEHSPQKTKTHLRMSRKRINSSAR